MTDAKKSFFEDLKASLEEAIAIEHGDKAPSRTTTVDKNDGRKNVK